MNAAAQLFYNSFHNLSLTERKNGLHSKNPGIREIAFKHLALTPQERLLGLRDAQFSVFITAASNIWLDSHDGYQTMRHQGVYSPEDFNTFWIMAVRHHLTTRCNSDSY